MLSLMRQTDPIFLPHQTLSSPPPIQIHPKQQNADHNKASINHFLRLRFTFPHTISQPNNPENICQKHHTASPDHGRENEHGIYKRPTAF